MSQAKCILCLREIEKDYERFLVESKKSTAFDAHGELGNLDFLVHETSEYICRQCHGLLKRRKNLRYNLKNLDEAIQIKYKSNIERIGLVYKGKTSQSPVIPSKRLRTLELEVNEGSLYLQNAAPLYASTPVKARPRMQTKPANDQPTTRPLTTEVKVRIDWPSNHLERKVPEQLQSLGKMLARGTYKQIASAVWRSPILRQEIQLLALKQIEKECTEMCSKKEPSCVRSPDKSKMLNFSFDKFNTELSSRAPFLHAVLHVSSVRSKRMKSNVLWKQAVGMAAAICLRNRSPYMNGVQLLLSIFGYHSNWMVS